MSRRRPPYTALRLSGDLCFLPTFFRERFYAKGGKWFLGKQSESPSLCDLRSPCDDCRHAFYQRYGTSLPSSLGRVIPSRLGFLCQGHLYWFLVRSSRIGHILLSRNLCCIHLHNIKIFKNGSFMGTWPQQNLAAIQWFEPFLLITSLRGSIHFSRGLPLFA